MATRTANKQGVNISKSTILHVNHAFNCIFLSRRCTTATWNFLIYKHGVREWQKKFSFSFSKHTVDTVLSDSTPENLANFWQIKWNWIRQMKFETVQFHLWSVLFGLLSPRNFATMATWRNDLSSLFDGIITVLARTCHSRHFNSLLKNKAQNLVTSVKNL